MLRALLHNPVTKAIIPLVPHAVASLIAKRMSRASRGNHHARCIKWDYSAILREFAAARFKEGYDAVIIGHFHLPLFEQSINGGVRTLLSVGDWISHFSYGEWMNGTFSLKHYKS
jgi:UDP-2,3-diacylglucosamine hydrolase